MKKLLLPTLLALILLISCGENEIQFETDAFKLGLNNKGIVTALADASSNYVVANQQSPFIAIRVDGAYHNPLTVSTTVPLKFRIVL